MSNKEYVDFEEVLDGLFGPVGSPERDGMEHRAAESAYAFRLGESIKKNRILQNLSQEELGKRIGLKKAQVSKMEKGHVYSIRTMGRAFRALGIETATLDLGSAGRVALW